MLLFERIKKKPYTHTQKYTASAQQQQQQKKKEKKSMTFFELK